MKRSTFAFNTGSRVVRVPIRLLHDQVEPHVGEAEAEAKPAKPAKPVKPRGVIGSVLVIAAGGFLAVMGAKYVKRWQAARAE